MTGLRPGFVVLTMGNRPARLAAALASARSQCPNGPIVVVANGVRPELPDDVATVHLPHNLGIPGGRHRGVRALDADVAFFLDDDAHYLHPGVTQRVLDAMDADPALAVVSLRIVDESGATLRRHVPRLGESSADRSGPVTYFLGGACAIRTAAYREVGGYASDFFYGHEELDLSWRLLEAGHHLHYDAQPAVQHPHVAPTAHQVWRYRRLGRNRVLLARRRLPAPLHVVHPTVWLVASMVRLRGLDARRAYLRGWREGWAADVDRHAMPWSTVVRMGRLRRPPLL